MITEAGSIGVSSDKLAKWREKYEKIYHNVCDEYISLHSKLNPKIPEVNVENGSYFFFKLNDDIEC